MFGVGTVASGLSFAVAERQRFLFLRQLELAIIWNDCAGWFRVGITFSLGRRGRPAGSTVATLPPKGAGGGKLSQTDKRVKSNTCHV